MDEVIGRHKLADALTHNAQLEADKKTLQRRIDTLIAIITELTHQARSGNVTAMPLRRPRSGSPSA